MGPVGIVILVVVLIGMIYIGKKIKVSEGGSNSRDAADRAEQETRDAQSTNEENRSRIDDFIDRGSDD